MGKYKSTLLLLAIGLTGIFFSVFFAKPWYGAYAYLSSNTHVDQSRDAIYVKKADLLNNMQQFEPISHEAKTVFRLTVPAIMKVFDLEYVDMYVLQIILGLLMHFMLAFMVYSITRNYITTLLVAIGAGCTYFGRSYFADTYIGFDTYAYFFTLLAIMGRKKPWILIPAIIALFFCDERGIIAISLVWLSIKLLDREDPQNVNWKDLFSFKDSSVYLYAAFIFCVALRLFLKYKFNMATPSKNVDLGFFFLSWKSFQLASWSGIVCFWGLLLLTVAVATHRKKFLFALLLIGVIIAFTCISAVVADRTKSIAYLFPLVLICVHYLYRSNASELNKLLFLVMIGNAIYPVSINPDPAGVYFYPYTMDIIMGVADAAHSILH